MDDIVEIIEKHKSDPGINVHKLKPGTIIKVQTCHSLYEFEVIDKPGYLLAKGGQYILEQQTIYLGGSTYGASMLRIGWIGRGMNMEVWLDQKRKLTTSIVREATVLGNGWEYSLWT